MVRNGGAWAAATGTAILLAGLAGCVGLDGGGDGTGSGTLVRFIELDADPSAAMMLGFGGANDAADLFSALSDTRFEYTHADEEADAAEILVEYQDRSGRERESPLSDFTSRQRIGRGDRVTIDDVLLSSPMRIKQGGQLLASRGAPPVDWLEVGGYPLPLAARPGGLAQWDVSGSTGLEAHLDNVRMSESGVERDYGCRPGPTPTSPPSCGWEERTYTTDTQVTDASLDVDLSVDGTIRLESLGAASSTRLRVSGDGLVHVAVLADAHVRHNDSREPSEAVDARHGADLDANLTGQGTATLTFAGDGLRTVAGEGSFGVAGRLIVWDADHPRSAGHQPVPIDDYEASGQGETDLGLDDNPVSFIAEALADLWRMDLAPGDEIRLATAGHGVPEVEVLVRVTGESSKTVLAGTFETVRVETSTSVVHAPHRRQRRDLPAARHGGMARPRDRRPGRGGAGGRPAVRRAGPPPDPGGPGPHG